MSDIIDFNSIATKNDNIKYDKLIGKDPYLKLTAINALDKNGFTSDTEGVCDFQKQANLEVTGILGIRELSILIQVFDNDNIQKIYNYISILNKKAKNKQKREEISNVIISIVVLFSFAMTIYGYYIFIGNIIKYISEFF